MIGNERHKILVVDDEEILAEIVSSELSSFGFEVSVAHSAEEAMELMEREAYSLLITDQNMPVVTGLELIESVSSHPNYKNDYFILLSGYEREDIFEEPDSQLESKVSLISKPINSETLKSEVNKYLSVSAR
jgi:CheY-like chemotaxis protein